MNNDCCSTSEQPETPGARWLGAFDAQLASSRVRKRRQEGATAGEGISFSDLGLTFYRSGPLCRSTHNWETLVPGVCRALVLTPVDKQIREGSFQPRPKLDPELVPTGLLPVWRGYDEYQPGFYRRGENGKLSTGCLPV
jgi:hypothetical protein